MSGDWVLFPPAIIHGALPCIAWPHARHFAARNNPSLDRAALNTLRKNLFDLYGYSGFIDANEFVEDSYPTSTSKWRSDGVTDWLYTKDGIHTIAFGAAEGAKAVDGVVF